MSFNPYIAGNPVKGNGNFIGRKDILKKVMQSLKNPNTNALVLFGQRRIGKTSILKEIEDQFNKESTYHPVYFDLQDKSALSLAEVLHQLAGSIGSKMNIHHPPKELFDRDGIFFITQFMLEVTKVLKNKQLVLLFDEFDILDSPKEGQAGKVFFPFLRQWMEKETGVMFIFILGRRPEELSTDTLSAFKAIPSLRVSLMNPEDTRQVIRLSEKDKSLIWSKSAMTQVFLWTAGHPYFTQLLCSIIWEDLHQDEEDANNTHELVDIHEVVDTAAKKAMEQGANAFHWIWQGLPPAEQIIMAAVAEADKKGVDHDSLMKILNENHIRLILRELEIAPETLVHWDILRPCDNGYCFAVPLMRAWVREEKPLSRVKIEMDNIEPLAENLYKSGEGFYKMGKLEDASKQLENALNVNPNHFRARLLLGNTYLGEKKIEESVKEFETAYKFDFSAAKNDLIKALFALGKERPRERRLEVYERILEIESQNDMAIRLRLSLLEELGKAAYEQKDFAGALDAYTKLGDQRLINITKQALKNKEIEETLSRGLQLKSRKNWKELIRLYETLLEKYPEEKILEKVLKEARLQATLEADYTAALNHLGRGEKGKAGELLLKVLNVDINYKDAAKHLYHLTGNKEMPETEKVVYRETPRREQAPPPSPAFKQSTEKKKENTPKPEISRFHVFQWISFAVVVWITILTLFLQENNDSILKFGAVYSMIGIILYFISSRLGRKGIEIGSVIYTIYFYVSFLLSSFLDEAFSSSWPMHISWAIGIYGLVLFINYLVSLRMEYTFTAIQAALFFGTAIGTVIARLFHGLHALGLNMEIVFSLQFIGLIGAPIVIYRLGWKKVYRLPA